MDITALFEQLVELTKANPSVMWPAFMTLAVSIWLFARGFYVVNDNPRALNMLIGVFLTLGFTALAVQVFPWMKSAETLVLSALG